MTTPNRRGSTSTSNFGVGRREGHDASGFYARFEAPELSPDETVLDPAKVDEVIGDPFKVGDSRNMTEVPDGAVALVVTSPPYFAGKQYEQELDRDGIPGSYREYLELLEAVFADCVRTLEPGGRIAVNVANLGRKPYRSLSADVITILQDRLRLLLRGELVWQKSGGSSGNCAWGSFARPSNPSLRDITERVVVASKGRFDRAVSPRERRRRGLPHEPTITPDRFMQATLDVWEIPPESARRVEHPAPFPAELPEWLIDLYTYRGDLVLDPFLGSGSTLVAAARTGRRFVGYDLDAGYVERARARVAGEGGTREEQDPSGRAVARVAEDVLGEAGFTITARALRLRGAGIAVSLSADDRAGAPWLFDVSGNFATDRGGLRRIDAVWRSLGRAQVITRHGDHRGTPLVLLTSHLPRLGTDGDRALRAASPDAFFDAIAMLSDDGRARLMTYADGGHRSRPLAGYWGEADLMPAPSLPWDEGPCSAR